MVHFDETSIRVNGKNHWVHNSSNTEATYQTVSPKRGAIGIEENGVLIDFDGIAVHDCWRSYWDFDCEGHAVCCAHLLRELEGVKTTYPDHNWATEFAGLLMDMKTTKEQALSAGKRSLPEDILESFSTRYDSIMEEASEQCPMPIVKHNKRGPVKKTFEGNLICRLKDLKDSVCMFVHRFEVPFDNNLAERDVRNVKTKAKVSGCFRTLEGAEEYIGIRSFLSTAAKHNMDSYSALTSAFQGKYSTF